MKKTTKIFGLLLTLFGLALVTGCTPITDNPEVPEEETITYTISFSNENNVEGIVELPTLEPYSAGETVEIDVSGVLNSSVAYIEWTDGISSYIPNESNKIIIENISSNITLTAKELWFKENVKVELYYNSEKILENVELSECNITLPISKTNLKKNFKVYVREDPWTDTGMCYIANPNPLSVSSDDLLLKLNNVKYTNETVKLYFSESIES